MHTETPDTFDQLRAIADLTRAPEDAARGRELLVRFLDTYPGNTAEQPIVDALCMRFGLLPYVSSTASGVGSWEAFALELHTPPELAEDGFTFHTEQQRVYQRLMDGENVILSAPTSFGKSVVVDALLASKRWSNLVLIVPTIALIDETRRRVSRFRNSYKVVTHPSEPFAERNIVVMTQERFLEIEQLPEVDFFMIDEFYKLGSGRKQDSRRTLLNLAWTKLKQTGAQYYLIGPNIDALDERLPEEFRGSLMRSTFKPVAVDVIDRSAVQDPREDLVQIVGELDGSTLVFTGSPEKAEALAETLGTTQRAVAGGMAAEVADWIAANYDESWNIVAALRAGVAVHTGPLPRGLQRIMVRLFNDGMVELMVCTSTLIEGVNTSARNVVIFEKKIDGQLIDFFTFSNIRGRAGRMFRHFVGRVVTYMAPPDNSATIVDIPIETQSELAADADLIQLPNSSLDERAMERVAGLFDQDVLSITTLRQNRGLDPSLQVAAARELRSRSQSSRENLTWQGRPTYAQARETLEFAFHNLLESHQRRGINFNMMWGKLQNARHNAGDLAAQVDQAMPYAREGQERSDVVTDVLRFQRNWMGHTIPSMLRGLQNIQAEVVSHGPRPNYEYLLREIESLYLPNGVAELEDYGLPTPLAMRLFELGLRRGEVHEVIQDLERVASDPAVTSRLSLVEHWILKDVVSGISGS